MCVCVQERKDLTELQTDYKIEYIYFIIGICICICIGIVSQCEILFFVVLTVFS